MNTNPLVLNSGLPITTALSASGPLNYAQAYFGNSSSWSTTSTTFVDPTNSGGNALTVRQSSGLTLTAAASNVCGITFTPANASAVYLITAQIAVYNFNVNASTSALLTDNTTIITSASTWNQSSGVASAATSLTASGIYVPGTSSPVTIKVQLGVSVGTGSIQSNTTGSLPNSVEWTVVQLSNNGGNNGVTAWNTNLSVTPSGAFGSYSGLVTQSRIVGNNLECKVYMTAGTTTASPISLGLPNGYTIDSSKLNSSGSFLNGNATSLSSSGAQISTNEWQSYPFFDGSDTANVYFSSGTSSGIFTKTLGSNVVDSNQPWLCEFSVPIVGLFAQSSSTGYAQAYFSSSPLWSITTTGSYGDFSLSSGSTSLATRTNSGISLTSAASDLPGITFTPASSSAIYIITASTIVSTSLASIYLGLQLTDGLITIAESPGANGGNTSADAVPITISGIYAPGTSSPVTVKFQGQMSSGTGYIGAESGSGASIEWTVLRIV